MNREDIVKKVAAVKKAKEQAVETTKTGSKADEILQTLRALNEKIDGLVEILNTPAQSEDAEDSEEDIL